MPYPGMFPEKELENTGNTYAIFAAESGAMSIIAIKPERGRQFTCEYGIFQLDKKYRYNCHASDIYFFDQRSANPISIFGLVDTQLYLRSTKKSALTYTDISTLTGTAQIEDENDYFKQQADLMNKLRTKTILWLNDYYNEDVVAKVDLIGAAMHKEKFRFKKSGSMTPWMPQQTMNVTDVAMVVINDKSIEIVTDVTQMLDDKTGQLQIKVGSYGTFVVADTKTRYRYKKNNVYIVAVQTTTPSPSLVTASSKSGKTKTELQAPTMETIQLQLNKVTEDLTGATEEIKVLQNAIKGNRISNEELESEPSPIQADPSLMQDKDYADFVNKAKKKAIINKKRNRVNELIERRKELLTKQQQLDEMKKNLAIKENTEEHKKGFPFGGNGKKKKVNEKEERKKRLIPIYGYKPFFNETVSINATVYLPKLNMLDPILAENVVKTSRYLKIKKDLVSSPVKKSPINVTLVIVVGFLLIIGTAVIFNSIIKPYLDQQALLERQRIQNNPQGQPSTDSGGGSNTGGGGFNFPIPSIPGITG